MDTHFSKHSRARELTWKMYISLNLAQGTNNLQGTASWL
jgi:hypothetical protein